MATSTFDSPDKSHHALDEQLYFAGRLGWLWMEAQENKPRAVHWKRDLIVTLWWGTKAVMGGEAAGLCQCFHKTWKLFIKHIFYAHWNSPTTTTKTPRIALSSLPTSDKNQIITGVTYALSAWYFNLAFQLIHPMIKASIIYSLWRPVEQEQQQVRSLIRVVHSVQMKLLIFITADFFSWCLLLRGKG